MRNFYESDYARNKKSKNIVCHFATGDFEITPKGYLAENPDKTKEDFLEWKTISDGMYCKQAGKDNTEGYKNISLQSLADTEDSSAPSPEMYLEMQEAAAEKKWQALAVEDFIKNGKLTVIQRRRFELFYHKKLSTRKIAKLEGKSQHSVWVCLEGCRRKFEKYLLKHCFTPP